VFLSTFMRSVEIPRFFKDEDDTVYYEIIFKSKRLHRRYSDFVHLYDAICCSYSEYPELETHGLLCFAVNFFDDLIEERKERVENYLNNLLRERRFWMSRQLQDFLEWYDFDPENPSPIATRICQGGQLFLGKIYFFPVEITGILLSFLCIQDIYRLSLLCKSNAGIVSSRQWKTVSYACDQFDMKQHSFWSFLKKQASSLEILDISIRLYHQHTALFPLNFPCFKRLHELTLRSPDESAMDCFSGILLAISGDINHPLHTLTINGPLDKQIFAALTVLNSRLTNLNLIFTQIPSDLVFNTSDWAYARRLHISKCWSLLDGVSGSSILLQSIPVLPCSVIDLRFDFLNDNNFQSILELIKNGKSLQYLTLKGLRKDLRSTMSRILSEIIPAISSRHLLSLRIEILEETDSDWMYRGYIEPPSVFNDFASLSQLKSLFIRGLAIGDEFSHGISSSCKSLLSFYTAGHLEYLTDDGLISLISSCTEIRDFRILGAVEFLTDRFLLFLLSHQRSHDINTVELQHSRYFSDSCVDRISLVLPHVRWSHEKWQDHVISENDLEMENFFNSFRFKVDLN
jgi:PX domain